MKVAVVGSRGIKSADVGRLLPPETTEIISGGARGVDTLAQAYAQEHGIPVRIFLPDYSRYGRGAPLKRNEQIARECDLLIAVWDGKSRGTAHVVAFARKLGREVRVYLAGELP